MNQSQGDGKEDQVVISATLATLLFGLTNFLGSIAAFLTVFNFKRTSVLIYCRLIMGVVHFALGMCIIYGYNFAAVLLLMVFIFVFQLSEGPILWIYSAEVCNDAAFGFAVFG